MLRRPAGNGYCWLLCFSVALFIYHFLRPFDYIRLWPDSDDYIEMANLDLLDPRGLATFRTWGYPLILKLYLLVLPPWDYLATCQLVLHIISVLVFYRGLRELDFPP